MNASLQAEPLYAGRDELAEGPVWREGALWWVNIISGELSRLDLSTGVRESRATGDLLGAAVPTADGRWLLAQRHRLLLLDWASGATESLAEIEPDQPGNRFNDGKCCPGGRFWIGTMSLVAEPQCGALYCVRPDGEVTQLLSDVTVSNGLGWSPGGERFYYVDTGTQRVDVMDYNPATGEARNRRPLVEIPADEGSPDGLAVDATGNVWLALWGGGCVNGYDGQTGELIARIEVPAPHVTSCCFGGEGLDQLFITTAWLGSPEAERDAAPAAGGLFVCQPGVKGQPANLFGATGAKTLSHHAT